MGLTPRASLHSRGREQSLLGTSSHLKEDVPVTTPPHGLPIYRVLTGPDDDQFCRRVSDALELGYQLHEGPTVAFNGEHVIVAQALLWPSS